MAAITITHGIGHAAFHQDFKTMDLPEAETCAEPRAGNDCCAELGLSYIGWIFSGFNPQTLELGSVDHRFSFTNPLAWCPQSTVKDKSLYEIAYSAGIKYMEDLLSTSFWTGLGDPKSPVFFKKARRQLDPLVDSLKF